MEDAKGKVSVPDPEGGPYIPKGSHPVETGRYLLATNEIDRMYEKLCQWIDNRSPGGIIYGRPRLGKSRAISYVMHILPVDYENIPVFLIQARQYRLPNENVFFQDLLTDVGHAFFSTGKANIKRDRLVRFLIERGEQSGQHRLILFIDDAQRLHELHYDWLMDVHNELDRAGMTMTVILVGQRELLHQRSAFIETKKAQIIGRFMVHEHQFTGMKDLDDIQSCLSGYDHDSEFPEGSGWSFTRYYLSEAYKNGHRLTEWAEGLYEVFSELRKEAGLTSTFEVPMQYLTLTVEYVLRRFGRYGDNCEWLTLNHWREAIARSGYIEAELYQDII